MDVMHNEYEKSYYGTYIQKTGIKIIEYNSRKNCKRFIVRFTQDIWIHQSCRSVVLRESTRPSDQQQRQDVYPSSIYTAL